MYCLALRGTCFLPGSPYEKLPFDALFACITYDRGAEETESGGKIINGFISRHEKLNHSPRVVHRYLVYFFGQFWKSKVHLVVLGHVIKEETVARLFMRYTFKSKTHPFPSMEVLHALISTYLVEPPILIHDRGIKKRRGRSCALTKKSLSAKNGET